MRKYVFFVYIFFIAIQGYSTDSTGTIIESDTSTGTIIDNEVDSAVAINDNNVDSPSVSLKAETQDNDSTNEIASDTVLQSQDTTIASSETNTEANIIVEKEETEQDTTIKKILPAKTALQTPKKSAGSKKVNLLMPVLRKKRRTAIIGNALFATGLIIKYGMIVPQKNKIEPDDTEGQLALMSPSLLSFGLKVAGTTMSCMRTSETVDKYEKYIGPDVPRNFSWFSFISGFGLMLGSQMAGGMAGMKENDNMTYAATGIDILQDAVWAFTNIYSILYINKLGEKAEASHVSVVPGVSSSGAPGLAVLIKF